MTIFAAALRVVGFTHAEAAEYLSDQCNRPISTQSVKDMASGRSKIGDGIWDALRDLFSWMMRASDEVLDLIEEKAAAEVSFAMDTSRASEWPSQRVHTNVLALVALQSDATFDD